MTTESNTIANPFGRGDTVVIPAGTVVHRPTHPDPSMRSKTLTRKQTVTLFSATPGWVERTYYTTMRDGSVAEAGMVVLPQVSWAGSGGYWCDVQVTPELCAANGVAVPELPYQDEDSAQRARLACVPSYGRGYTDAWRD